MQFAQSIRIVYTGNATTILVPRISITSLFPLGPHLPEFLLPFRKPKRVRTAFSPSQLLKLEQAFEKNQYVVGQERKELAKSLHLSETQVNIYSKINFIISMTNRFPISQLFPSNVLNVYNIRVNNCFVCKSCYRSLLTCHGRNYQFPSLTQSPYLQRLDHNRCRGEYFQNFSIIT